MTDNQTLLHLADALDALVAVLRSSCDGPTPNAAAPERAPEPEQESEDPAPTITLETVRAKLADLSRGGYTQEVRTLIRSFGASKLSEVRPEDYARMLSAAEELAA